MDTTGTLVFLACLFGVVLGIIFVIRRAIKKYQKRKAEKEKRKKEAARLARLISVGEHIQTTVRHADEHNLRTQGRHPDTNQHLSFWGRRQPGQRIYQPGDLVHVLVDLNNPGSYRIEWEPETQKKSLPKEASQKNNLRQRRTKVKCFACDGKRQVRCKACNGTRQQMVYRPSQKQRPYVWRTCQACQGSGRARCTDCKGTGYIFI